MPFFEQICFRQSIRGSKKANRAGDPPLFFSRFNNKGPCPILAILPIAWVGNREASRRLPGLESSRPK
jgi:hypothetical protein